MSEETCLRESVARMQSALDQWETERKQLREILDKVQHTYEHPSTALAQFLEEINASALSNRLTKGFER